MPNNVLDTISKSPLLMVGVAGAAVFGIVYVTAKNRPNVETVGGNLPFSFDALANWLAAREGGPGTPDPTPSPAPVPISNCPPGFVRPPGGGDCILNVGCLPWMDCYQPPTPDPKPIPPWGQGGDCGSVTCAPGFVCSNGRCIPQPDAIGNSTDGTGSTPPPVYSDAIGSDNLAPESARPWGVGGGTQRIFGLSPQVLYTVVYNSVYFQQQSDNERGPNNGGY